MKALLIAMLMTMTACAADVEDAPADTGLEDAGVTLCKVDSECAAGQSCEWQSIATYNPNVPGGFSGECRAK